MIHRRNDHWSRREFLTTAALAATGGVLGLRPESLAAEPPPETKRIRLIADNLCTAALMHVAQDFISREGFTDVQYLSPKGAGQDDKLLASGGVDIDSGFALRHIIRVEAGDPIVFLAGLHPGCYEL